MAQQPWCWWPGPENDVYNDQQRAESEFADKGALRVNRVIPRPQLNRPMPWLMEFDGPTGGAAGRSEREMFGGDRQRRRASW